MSEQLRQQPDSNGEEENLDQEWDAASQERREKMVEDADALFDEIDAVLEANAEDVIQAYIQKGGQ